ncbi:uncharacterized protein EV154DRAFT_554492 [Mucor mucedo]|uniref:uncharacterized protein n=1 Tax=Mucor mucedo TaxID=29922 RepID=UPI00221EC84C|nr:uncharacterized protein EV154DRAFT_554492 [Mucor mucedo]KAI7887682.1 hypothetical protein EV154DRAFT_554492 [Mucor mucedo]
MLIDKRNFLKKKNVYGDDSQGKKKTTSDYDQTNALCSRIFIAKGINTLITCGKVSDTAVLLRSSCGHYRSSSDYVCLWSYFTGHFPYLKRFIMGAGSISEYQTLLESISLPVMGECEKDKWMIMGATGYLIADVYSRPVYFFSKKESITILPNCILNENKPNPQQQKQQQTQQQKQQQTQQQKQQQTQQQKQQQTQQQTQQQKQQQTQQQTQQQKQQKQQKHH